MNNNELQGILQKNTDFYKTLENIRDLCLPYPYWIAGGCIFQQIFNHITGRFPLYGIGDIDFVYYDVNDLSYDAEDKVIKLVSSVNVTQLSMDIKNTARCHIWYKERWKMDQHPFTSLEDAMSEYPFVNQMLAVWLEGEELKMYAPLGLEDTCNLIIRRHNMKFKYEWYVEKVKKWQEQWPELREPKGV